MTGGIVILVVILISVMPYKNINWGRVSLNPSETVSVTGEAKSQQKNQIAKFSAGVNSVKENKEEAVNEVNTKMTELINALKQFGIPTDDIKTQNMSVYQERDYMKNSDKGMWSVNNSVEIVLRDIDKSSSLTDLLNTSGANNVYGPNFGFDDTKAYENELVENAMKDAREKAEIMAKASGRKLGKVLSISEGYGGTNNYDGLMLSKSMGSGAPVEIGTATISKSLSVVFELK